MKRIFTLLFAAMLAGQAWADDFTIGKLYYTVTDETNHYVSVSRASNYDTPSGDLVIPESVTDPESNVKYTVTAIANYAFHSCADITSVTIPGTVTTIGMSAFYNCSGLTTVSIPSSITEIKFDDAFAGCISLASINVAEGNANYASEDGVLFNNDKTRLLYYPASKTGSTYSIPGTVTTISSSAFENCGNLTSITIPNSVKTIYSSAFRNCSNLTSITIPESVFTLGNYAFYGCVSLTEINVASGNRNYSSEDGVLFDDDKTELMCYPASKASSAYTVPESVTSIDEAAFYGCSNLKSVVIPNTVTSLGDGIFQNCASLESVTLPSSITEIPSAIFGGCTSLTTIEIPNTVTFIGNGAFSGSGLTEIVIPSSVTEISSFAFQDCNGLTTITIPASVEKIGYYAFKGCKNLTINCCASPIPGGWNAYWNYDNRPYNLGSCGGEQTWTVTVSANNSSYGSVSGGGTYANGSTVTITATPADGYKFVKWSNGLTSSKATIIVTSNLNLVAEFAKNGSIVASELLYEITSDSTVEVVKSDDYKTMTEVVIPETVEIDGKTYKVTDIGYEAFDQCYKLKSVTIPNTVTVISGYAFSHCDNLTSITIPNSVSVIGYFAFFLCNKLESINVEEDNNKFSSDNGVLFNKDKTELICCPAGKTGSYDIPNQTETIINNAFCCSDLVSISIPNSVKTFESFAFQNCRNLTTIVIPNSVTEIDNATFSGCDNVSFYCEAESKPEGWDEDWNSSGRPVIWGFDPSTKIFNITLSVNREWCGKVTGGGLAAEGSKVTITATPEQGYHFVKWSNGLTTDTATITVTSDTTLVAEFAEDKYWTVTLSANIEHGRVDKISGSNLDGSIFTAYASPFPGYKFVKWSNGLTTDTISITLTSDTTLTAEFAEIVYAGTCGDGARWSFSMQSKTLTISGTGSIDRYKTVDLFSTEVNRPWQEIADQIEKVVIGEGITNLGSRAFCYLNNLKEVNISSTCNSYGSMSFADCPNLKKLVVAANSVNQANEYCFSNYDSCTVYVPADRVDYYKKDIIFGMFKNMVGGYTVTIDDEIKNGTVDVESYIVPEGGKVTVTPKPNEGYIVTDVTFKDEQGYYVFATYTNGYQYWIENNAGSNIIVKVEFSREGGDGFTYKVISSNNIEITGYQGTDSVITIPSKVTDNGVEYTVTSISDRAFYDNNDVKSITIPNTVTNIGESAFAYTDNLISLTIPNSIKTIGKYAFADVKNVIYHGSATGSPWEALTVNGIVDGNCIFADAEKTHLTAYINPTNEMENTIDLPESVVTIGTRAFIGGSFKYTIYNNAYYWGNEENPYLILWETGDDNDITSFEVHEGCKYIYANAFALQYALESVTIPNSVISIGGGAFFNCDQLSTITIPDGVKVIGAGAFQNCGELVSVTVGKSVTNIDDYAFCNCQKLRTVNIPESVERIGDGAFCDCYNLSSLHIPKSVTEIGEKAFDNYYHDITIYSDATEWPAGWLFSESEVREVIFKTTPVAETAANAVNIYAYGNTIVVENATDEIRVYNAMGALVGCVGKDVPWHVSTGETTITVNTSGVYIVKTGATVKRVIVNE